MAYDTNATQFDWQAFWDSFEKDKEGNPVITEIDPLNPREASRHVEELANEIIEEFSKLQYKATA